MDVARNKLKVVVEQGEDGWLVAHVPELPGCVTQGKTMEEVRERIADAISGCLAARQARLERQSQAELELVAA